MTIEQIIELPNDDLAGETGVKHYHIHFAGKTDTSKFRYLIFNEKVAGEIGRVMGLPCPEVLVEPFNGRYYFFSHWKEISQSGMELPPKTARERQNAITNHLDIVHGMLVFDLYIANNDRRMDNLICRSDGTFSMIDHGNALHYYVRSSRPTPHGVKRLDEVRHDIRNMFEEDRIHHFMYLLPSGNDFDKWIERVRAVPDHFIEAIVIGCPDTEYLKNIEKQRTIEFLIERKTYLADHIEKHRDYLLGMRGEA